MLRDKQWAPGYTSDDGNLAEQFYVPALLNAVQYDRGTGYYDVKSLTHLMHGIEGLISRTGKMRILVGCILNAEEIEAIQKGEDLKKQVENNLCNIPLDPPDQYTANALELLSWMIAMNYLEIKIAIRCNSKGDPETGLYHQKIGIIRDSSGDKLAWNGSNNETLHGQFVNSEYLSVFTSWGASEHQHHIETLFENDWSDKNNRLKVMNIPDAVRQNLLRYTPPKGEFPTRLTKSLSIIDSEPIWSFIGQSHKIKDGEMVGLATAPIEPWPHQVHAFRRLYAGRPTRLLIADEVGLGKTIQAGLFLRQAWLEGKHRILVMAPAGLTKQWQIELREKLNLDWPIYDGKNLVWQNTHARGKNKIESIDNWTIHGPVIISSHLARMKGRDEMIVSTKWDVVILDEAHYARQSNPTNPDTRRPNKMLKLMRRLQKQTKDLVLLTATPMQIHPVEIYDLLNLLGMPTQWSWKNFERFYRRIPFLNIDDLPFMMELFRASTNQYGTIDSFKFDIPKLALKKAIKILGGDKNHRLLEKDINIIKKVLLLCSPITHLISRNTRKQLSQYIKDNNLDWKLGTRKVDDIFVIMSSDERAVYDTMNDYISNTWNKYKGTHRQAVGFTLIIYRKRLASSFAALEKTLENHLARLDGKGYVLPLHEDEYDADDMDADDIKDTEEKALKTIDRESVYDILDMIRKLPPDTKFNNLVKIIKNLQHENYKQIMIFTQFTDTMDFLKNKLTQNWRVMCYSGKGGEEPNSNGFWEKLSRDDTKAKFFDGSVDILICTDAASEGLNFQFCGAMINYDMPWNPMRVEQRIGRIDRIGQEHEIIRIVNMYYDDTVESDIYRTLRDRIDLFEGVVGSLQPILSNLDRKIKDNVLGHTHAIVQDMEQEIDKARKDHLVDLDDISKEVLQPKPIVSPVTMDDLERMSSTTDLVPQEYKIKHTGKRQYSVVPPNTGVHTRITTDRKQFERHGDSIEFWSPGSPAFPKLASSTSEPSKYKTLKELLDSVVSV